ncbi:M23 family metallopeptidase [Pelagibius sp.]|uniref:M23 family metallopeptidase n=1 Tax=Pelagibius sp. TaxID=1931238 RepID=UPI0026356B45|nr:M23 family metallopeptidase [Pelagibius sp.]
MARTRLGALLASVLLVLAPNAGAEEASPPGGGFDLPVDCAMGSLCTIQNYVDYDPGKGWKDHTCGSLSYDGHRGIDFRVPTEIEMRAGVDVVAAADGQVIFAFDGQPDVLMQDSGPGKTREERNGNWVAIDHGDDWITTYAHMLKGSIAVKKGDRVKRGDTLGLIGLSGNSDFPHLHFAVAHGTRLLDPFTGLEPSADCGAAGTSLWSAEAAAQLDYQAGGLLSAGFAAAPPSKRQMLAGIRPLAQVSAEERILVFWAASWGLLAGDRQSMMILAPDGSTFFRNERELEGNKAIWTTHFGIRRKGADLVPGEYVGLYRVRRLNGDWPKTVLSVRKTIVVR